jgi:hypothetical protein
MTTGRQIVGETSPYTHRYRQLLDGLYTVPTELWLPAFLAVSRSVSRDQLADSPATLSRNPQTGALQRSQAARSWSR